MAIDYLKNKKGINSMFIKYGIQILLICIIAFPTISEANTLLIFRNSGKNFEEAVKGISQELLGEFTIKEVLIGKESKVDDISNKMTEINPNVVVLMDNRSIKLFKKYQAKLAPDAKIVPSVSIMGVLIGKTIKNLKNSTGILYEIPIVSSAVNFRSLVGTPIKKIGVVHRKYLVDYLETNKVFCQNEGIELKTVLLENGSKDYKDALKKGLVTLIKKEAVDVLWIPNDNALLSKAYFGSVWLPTLAKYNIPLIVGVEVLVQPKFNFGAYAVLPDHVSLGSQAAELIYDIMDNDWQVSTPGAEQPLSIYQIVNLKQVSKKYKVSEGNLANIDKVIK